MKGGKSCVLLRIALDQDALSFHVQPTALRAFFFPPRKFFASPTPLLSCSFPSEHRRGDSFWLAPAF